LIGGVLILGGVVGAFVVPLLSEKIQRRKPFLIACTAGSALATLVLGWLDTFTGLMMLAMLLSFVFMPSYPLLIESSRHFSGEHAAGATMSLLTLVGNAGGVIVIIAMPSIKGESPVYHATIVFLVVLLLICAGVALRLPETLARKDAATRRTA
jgi:MFS family permease